MSEYRDRLEAALKNRRDLDLWPDGELAEQIDRETGHTDVCEALADCLMFFEDAYQRMMASGHVDAGIAAGTMGGRCRAALSLARGEKIPTVAENATVQSPGSTPSSEASMEKGQE